MDIFKQRYISILDGLDEIFTEFKQEVSEISVNEISAFQKIQNMFKISAESLGGDSLDKQDVFDATPSENDIYADCLDIKPETYSGGDGDEQLKKYNDNVKPYQQPDTFAEQSNY